MKRAGFTMIELIFVIVILGILAAVAIPRMVGVQDDAKVAAEKGIIGGVRGGISTANGTCLARQWGNGGLKNYPSATQQVAFSAECFPIDLDTASTTKAASAASTDIFSRVLNEAVDNWSELATAGEYEGPATSATGVSADVDSNVNTNKKWVYVETGTGAGSIKTN